MSDDLGPLLVDPTFAPISYSKPKAPGQGGSTQSFAVLPSFSTYQLQPAAPGNSSINRIAVGAPTLLKALRLEPDLNDPDRADSQLYYRPLGTVSDVAVSDNNPAKRKRLNFMGPYAWLPRAGEYEIIWRCDTTAITDFACILDVAQAVSYEEWQAIANSEAARVAQSIFVNITAGNSIGVTGGGGLSNFMLLRKLIVTNFDLANYAQIDIGLNGSLRIPPGSFLQIDPEFLGRGSVYIASQLGADVGFSVSLW